LQSRNRNNFFLALSLQDLTFIDELPNEEKGLINFDKRKKIAKILMVLTNFQKTSYEFNTVLFIQHLLLRGQVMSEEKLFKESYKIECRVTK
jgi:hypothetical protein